MKLNALALLIPAMLLMLHPSLKTAVAGGGGDGPVVVLTWGGGQTVRACYDQTVCRGYGAFDQVNVTVDGVEATPPAYLDIIKRPYSQRPGCSPLNLPGYWEMGVGEVRFNNFDYASGQTYNRVNLCSRRGGRWYGAEDAPDGQTWAWVAPDGSEGTIVVGASLADVNFDGQTSVQDIFDFLEKFRVLSREADLDGSGLIDLGDIFAFVGAWLLGE